jgi:hypothetical protein
VTKHQVPNKTIYGCSASYISQYTDSIRISCTTIPGTFFCLLWVEIKVLYCTATFGRIIRDKPILFWDLRVLLK